MPQRQWNEAKDWALRRIPGDKLVGRTDGVPQPEQQAAYRDGNDPNSYDERIPHHFDPATGAFRQRMRGIVTLQKETLRGIVSTWPTVTYDSFVTERFCRADPELLRHP